MLYLPPLLLAPGWQYPTSRPIALRDPFSFPFSRISRPRRPPRSLSPFLLPSFPPSGTAHGVWCGLPQQEVLWSFFFSFLPHARHVQGARPPFLLPPPSFPPFFGNDCKIHDGGSVMAVFVFSLPSMVGTTTSAFPNFFLSSWIFHVREKQARSRAPSFLPSLEPPPWVATPFFVPFFSFFSPPPRACRGPTAGCGTG